MKLQLTFFLATLASAFAAEETPEELRAKLLRTRSLQGDDNNNGAGDGPGGDGNDFPPCFSAFDTVEAQGKGMISMDSLEIGDYVRAGKDFSRVFSFAHLDLDAEGNFLQIHTEGSVAPLESPTTTCFSAMIRLLVPRKFRLVICWETTR